MALPSRVQAWPRRQECIVIDGRASPLRQASKRSPKFAVMYRLGTPHNDPQSAPGETHV